MRNTTRLKQIVQNISAAFRGGEGGGMDAQEFIDRLESLGQRLSIYTYEVHGREYSILAFSESVAAEKIKEDLASNYAGRLDVLHRSLRLVNVEVVTARWLTSKFDRASFQEVLADVERDVASPRDQGPETITTSSVEALCNAVGITHYPIKETVYFGHGGGHQPATINGVGTFYIDLDLLEGDGKEQRMQNALEILAKNLGSNEALRALSQNKIMSFGTETLRWPNHHPTKGRASSIDRGR